MSSELHVARRLRTDFPFFCEKLLRIKTKDGEVVPFKLNRSQLRLWKEIKKRKAANIPVRIMVLKARQMGVSTFVQAYMFWEALTSPGHNCLVIAHQEDAAKELFTKIELMYRLLPEGYYAALEKIKDTSRQGKKLAWGGELNTLIYVDTANNKKIGRSQTFQHVHVSELAFYEHPDEIMFGLGQSVPRKAGTTIIWESTANGVGNYFHRGWRRAIDGDSTYSALFFPWFDDPDYQVPVPEDFQLEPGEARIKRKYKLTNEQVLWRRQVIDDECDGDVDKFRQEYPAEPEEAFLVTGNTYFNRRSLELLEKNIKEPERQGMLSMEGGKPVLHDAKDGSWKIWKKPIKNCPYVIGADVAGGTSKDFSAAIILDPKTLEVVATFRGKLDPDEFANELRWMGRTYNNALIAVEKNGEGRATVLKLVKDLFYPRNFYHVYNEEWSGGVQSSWGWSTNAKTRPVMLAQCSELVRQNQVRIYDQRLVAEMMSFIRVDGSKLAAASEGCNDDMVMALCIATSAEVRQMGSISPDLYDDMGYDIPRAEW